MLPCGELSHRHIIPKSKHGGGRFFFLAPSGLPVILQPHKQANVVVQILGGNAFIPIQIRLETGVKVIYMVDVIDPVFTNLELTASCAWGAVLKYF